MSQINDLAHQKLQKTNRFTHSEALPGLKSAFTRVLTRYGPGSLEGRRPPPAQLAGVLHDLGRASFETLARKSVRAPQDDGTGNAISASSWWTHSF
jgi:hypothetical protein